MSICTTCDYTHPEGYCPVEEGGIRADQTRFLVCTCQQISKDVKDCPRHGQHFKEKEKSIMNDDTITFTQRQLSSLLHFQSTYWLNEVRSFDDFIEAEVGKRDALLHPKEGWVYLNTKGNMAASIEIIEKGRTGRKPDEWLPTYKVRILKGTQIANDLIEEKEFEFSTYITGDINDPLGARGYVRSCLTTQQIPA